MQGERGSHMLGEDVELSEGERDERIRKDEDSANTTHILGRKRIVIKSDGTHVGTTVTTSDGLDLGQYGVVAAQWGIDANNGGMGTATLVFFGAAVEIDSMLGLVDFVSVPCTCPDERFTNSEEESTAGPWHNTSCPRFRQAERTG